MLNMRDVAGLLSQCDPFGPTHIVTGDGNVDDDSIDFCLQRGISNLERKALTALKKLPYGKRLEAWRISTGEVGR